MQRTSLPSTFGMSGITPWANIGKVDNSGVDISVDYNKAFSKDLILSLRGTFTYAHNEIVEMDEPKYKWAYQYKAGHPINSIQCLIAEGLFRDEEEIASSPSQDIYATTYPIRPGDVKYRDLNDDKIIDDNDCAGRATRPSRRSSTDSAFRSNTRDSTARPSSRDRARCRSSCTTTTPSRQPRRPVRD